MSEDTNEIAAADPSDGPTEEDRARVAGLAIGAGLRHAAIAQSFAASSLGGGIWNDVSASEALSVFHDKVGKVKSGEMAPAIAILMAQAISLDAVFTEMVRRAGANMGEHPQAFERYMRMAMKAQANSRTTLETMAKIARGGEQIVRHVHVNAGGQAVVTEQFHHHAGGTRNAQITDQPHATVAIGEGAALPGSDPVGNAVPISGGQRT